MAKKTMSREDELSIELDTVASKEGFEALLKSTLEAMEQNKKYKIKLRIKELMETTR